MLKNFYVDHNCFVPYTPDSSLKSWGMRLATRVRCCRKTPSAVKLKCRSFHVQGNLYVYPFVSGELKPVERRKNASSYGKSGRAEAGMRHKGFYNFL